MNALDQEWLSEWLGRPWPRGLFAVGGIGPDEKPFVQSLTDGPPNVAASAPWPALHDAVTQVDAHGCGNGSSTWVFETAIMWAARRVDGAWAGVIGPRELPESIQKAVKARLADFLAEKQI